MKNKRYITSDLHLGHANIIKYCNRPFSSVQEMDNTIINNWNKTVKPEDEVYFLGDFCFGRPGNVISKQYRQKLNGKIHLVLGNHDKYIDKDAFDSVQDYLLLEENGKKILLIHYPIYRKDYSHLKEKMSLPEYDMCFYGHVHNSVEDEVFENHFNMCVEKTKYTPINFDILVNLISSRVKGTFYFKDV
jgi:calcineurin-like phosphoesterase family protein